MKASVLKPKKNKITPTCHNAKCGKEIKSGRRLYCSRECFRIDRKVTQSVKEAPKKYEAREQRKGETHISRIIFEETI